jgi:hypothetical protein
MSDLIDVKKLTFGFKPLQSKGTQAEKKSFEAQIANLFNNRYYMYRVIYDTDPEVLMSTFRVMDHNLNRLQLIESDFEAIQDILKYNPNLDQEKIKEYINRLDAQLLGENTPAGVSGTTPPVGGAAEVLEDLRDYYDGGRINKKQYTALKNMVKENFKQTQDAAQKYKTRLTKYWSGGEGPEDKGDEGGVPGAESTEVGKGAEVAENGKGAEGEKSVFDEYFAKMKDGNDKNLDMEIEHDQRVAFENEDLTMNDRYIFIGITFVIRLITVFLIEFSVRSLMLTTFDQALIYYIIIYSLFMVFLTFVVSTSDIGLKMLLYYFDTSTHGYSRLMVHLLLVSVLIPIVYIVKSPKLQAQNVYTNSTFEYNQHIISTITIISWVIWLFTSLVALRF